MPVIQFNDPSKLREFILRAFRNVRPPVLEEIAYKDDWDYEAIIADLGQYIEEPPPGRVLEEHAKSLAALTPQAFVFFLPAYMSYSVGQIDSEVTDILVSELHTAIKSTSDYWKSRLDQLTSAHREAVCNYVSFVIPKGTFGLNSDQLDEISQFWCANDRKTGDSN